MQLIVHFKRKKNCPTIPPGTLNMFYILVIHSDNAQISFVLIALCQPGGAAINFSKSLRNQNQTTLLLFINHKQSTTKNKRDVDDFDLVAWFNPV